MVLIVLGALVVAFGVLVVVGNAVRRDPETDLVAAVVFGSSIALGGALLAGAGRTLAREARTGVVVGLGALALAALAWGLGGILAVPWVAILLLGAALAFARRRRRRPRA